MAPDAPLMSLPPTARRPSAAVVWARDNARRAARAELRLAWLGVPAALVACLILAQTGLGGFLLRTFFGMWLHELGHAAAAWMCGFFAIPGPWKTSISDSRSFVFALLIAGGLVYAIWRARENEDDVLGAAAGAALVAQIFGTVLLPAASAQTLITFSGDGGALVFGAALMATFFTPPGHKLHRDWLRWGFLVIGAGSFADCYSVWWAARTDHSVIPFGEISGCGDSDPSRLVDGGWTVPGLVARYVGLGLLCLAVVFTLQVLHVRRTRAALEEIESQARGGAL
jgi:hypothetical protein